MRTRRIRRTWRPWAAVGFVVLAGCAWPRSLLAPRETSPPVAEALAPEVPPTAPIAEPAPANEGTVAAIEAFLARTSEYSTPTPQAAVPQGSLLEPSSPGPGESPDRPPGPRSETENERALANTQVSLSEPSMKRPVAAVPALMAVSLRRPPNRAPEPSSAAVPNQPNAPDAVDSGTDRFDWDRAVQWLEVEARSKRDFSSALAASLTRSMLGRDAATAETGAELPRAARDVLQRVVGVVSGVREAFASPDSSADAAIRSVDDLRDLLARRVDLEVSAVSLCRKVLTFGVYDELSEADLAAGRSIPAIAYCEVRNFASEPDSEGRFVTRLSSRLEILTADGRSVLERSEPEIVDSCRIRRRDFFVAQRITLPATLASGEYVLKLTVDDLQSQKIAEAVRAFSLSAATPVAHGR